MNNRKFTFFALLVAALLPALAYAQSTAPGSAGAGISGEGYACTMQYQPVCGAREVQCIKAPCYPQYEKFGNSCMLHGEGAIYIHEGECTLEEKGPYMGGTTPAPSTQPYQPPATCTAWNDGCNSCSRGENGMIACTKMYCAEPGPGYCTAGADSAPAVDTPGVTNPSTPVSSPVQTAVEGSTGGLAQAPSVPVFREERSWSMWSFVGATWNTLLLWLGF